MADPFWKDVGTGVNVSFSSAAVAPTFPSTVASGDLAILTAWIKNDADASADQPTGWLPLFTGSSNIDNGADAMAVYYKICDGTEDGTSVTVPITEPTPSGRRAAWINTFGGDSSVWHFESSAIEIASTLATTITDRDVTTLGPNRLAVNLIGYSNRQTGGQEAFTGETGSTWVASAYYEGGNNPTLSIQTATMTSSGTVGGGSDATITSSIWTILGFAIYADAPAGSPTGGMFNSDILITRMFHPISVR